MKSEIEQVQIFYYEVWNKQNKAAIPDILADTFIFRSSLGIEKTGHAGFIEYLDFIHDALGEYNCTIKESVTQPEKVFAKVTFSGIHQGEFMGARPSGRRISWDGAALFNFKNRKITSLWVLGDLKSLEFQLHEL